MRTPVTLLVNPYPSARSGRDVTPGVAGRVRDAWKRDPRSLAACAEQLERSAGTGCYLSPTAVPRPGCHRGGSGAATGFVGSIRCRAPALVYLDLQIGEAQQQRIRRTGVVEMDAASV